MSTSSDVEESEMSVYDVRPTPAALFPIEISAKDLLPHALSEARMKIHQKARLRALFRMPYMQQGFECLYWFTFCKMFYEDSSMKVQETLREQLAAHYVQLLVKGLEEPKKDYFQFMPLVFSHCICSDFYHRFTASRPLLTETFILTATHVVYETLLGVQTTDVFLRQQLQALYDGRAFQMDPEMECGLDRVREEVEERRVPTAMKAKMERVPGGQEFAEDLYKRSTKPKEKKVQQNKTPVPSERRGMSPAEARLEQVVRNYSTPHMRREDSSRRSRVFNCVKLSPMLSRHFHSGNVCYTQSQVPYKQKVMTTHPLDLPTSMPHSIQMLQRHCQEKHQQRQAALASRRKAEELARFKSEQSEQKQKFRLGEGISPLGIEHSPCLEGLTKIIHMFRDKPPVSFFSSYE